jgi:hypothetical protein
MKNHNDFSIKLFSTDDKVERYKLLKAYMLNLNFEELMAWTKSDFAQLNASLDKGITKEEREKLLAQLTKFDDFQAVFALQKRAA